MDQLKQPSRRAKVACKACNARRVKCDVAVSRPCWHCRERQTTCELVESRRGRYQRTQRAKESRLSTVEKPPAQESLSTSLPHNAQDEIYNGGHWPSANNNNNESVGEQTDGPDMLFARMADPSADRPERTALANDHRTLYLGEAFSLTFIVKTVCSPSGMSTEPQKVHYSVPSVVSDENSSGSASSACDLDPDTFAFLQAKHAFDLPPKELSDILVETFFNCVHPAFPVFNRQDFNKLYTQRKVSLLVMHTICFLAVIMCDDDTVRHAGFTDKYQARRTYYARAKALYDSDFEKDQTLLVAVLFLLGFWWEKPQDQKDTWHWLGCAISLAQTLGMHRSTATSSLSPVSRALWKRIWWSIYVRDRHAAAALGRPCRIRDEDCDVEPLVEADFDVDQGTQLFPNCEQAKHHVMYAIHMSNLAVILGRVLNTKFSPACFMPESAPESIEKALDAWIRDLPVQLNRRSIRKSADAPFWACMLHAHYHNCKVLLHRPSFINIHSDEDAEDDVQISGAADEITRIAEDLLASKTLRQGQLHLVPALFAALGVHATMIRRRDPIRRLLAENRSRQCMLALSELSKAWPVAGWILRLFISLMLRLTGRDFANEISLFRNGSATPRQLAISTETSFQPVNEARSGYDRAPAEARGLLLTAGVNPAAVETPTRSHDDPSWGDQSLPDFDFVFEGNFGGFEPFDFGFQT